MSPRPRVGFLGLGWIGQARLKALAEADLVEIVGLADPNAQALENARPFAPRARVAAGLDELLSCELDALVIATPSGLHAAACERALERGLAVFCQKPLARNASEVERVLRAAAEADRLLRVDLCYRQTKALGALRELVSAGSLGRIYAAELTFHNAYGPDKSWARDPELAGGGCLIDLGVHLLDAAFWVLGAEHTVTDARASLYAQGEALSGSSSRVEDFALGQLELDDSTALSVACSWQSSFGDHARIRVALFGTNGGAAFENVNGSFYDFVCERFRGPVREPIYQGSDEWGGRAIVSFAQELIVSPSHRPDAQLLRVSQALDALYARSGAANRIESKPGAADLRVAS